jgi:hypothetical protein
MLHSNTDAGLFVAPGFAVGQIVFLIAFCLYLAATIYALVADFGAASVLPHSFFHLPKV